MKTVILTVEVKIDEQQIIKRYPNFGINYEVNADKIPTKKGMIAFAKSNVMTENALADFGFSSKITKAEIKDS
jgi:hypothetical protein